MKRFGGTLTVFAVLAGSAAAQDLQLGARAKGMGGSYTAFGDDATAIWYNPAGTATQRSKLAISYQSFVTYEANVISSAPAKAQATLHDPAIVPAFAGVLVALGDEKLSHAFSLGYVSDLKVHLGWIAPGPAFTDQTRQWFSRFRFAYAIDFKLREEEKGLFSRVAVGAAVDWASSFYEQSIISSTTEDTRTAFGGGAGVLFTAYGSDDLTIDVGASYNSRIVFAFSDALIAAGNWPDSFSVGVAAYVGLLKITADVQSVFWHDAFQPSAVGGAKSFDNVVNLGVGAEYLFEPKKDVYLLVRAGYRFVHEPWGTKTPLKTAVGMSQLNIDTESDAFHLISLGAGIYWTTKEGMKRGFDAAVEFLGDRATVAVSYSHEF